MLAIFEPMALPTAKPGTWFQAAVADTNISGAEVPKAITVKPINIGDMPRWLAVAAAPSTKRSALQISKPRPKNTARAATSIN
jgi:hypothetical protein